MTSNRSGHIRLNSHPGGGTASRFPIHWGAPSARERGPVQKATPVKAGSGSVGPKGGEASGNAFADALKGKFGR